MVSSRCTSCLFVFGLVIACVMVVIGIVGIAVGSDILQKQVNKQLPLTAQSDQLASWEDPPVPIYLQFWLWECVNVDEVLQGEKPAIFERGPYTYREVRTKINVRFNENGTVTYTQPTSYTFLPEMSPCKEEDEIKMINAPIVTVVSLVRSKSNITQEILDLIKTFTKESLFVTHTAREWIWGYEDRILKAAQKIPILGKNIPDDHFGYFYQKNSSDDGLYTVSTGAGNIDQLNIIDKWNGTSYLNFWPNINANQINGTDGSWFPPLYKKALQDHRAYIFSTDVCRSLYAKFANHSSVRDIPTEKFSIPAEIFANATINPDNEPFGVFYSGVLNVSICRQQAPIFISLPHLLYADDRLTNKLVGIAPNEELHQTFFEIEQHTGLVLRAQKRLQINIYLAPDEFIDDMKNILQLILPAIWINESTVIDEKSANDLKGQVLRPFAIVQWVSIVLIALGSVIFIITIVIFVRRRSKRGSSAPLLYAGPITSITRDDEH